MNTIAKTFYLEKERTDGLEVIMFNPHLDLSDNY